MTRDSTTWLSEDEAKRLLDSWAPDRSTAPVPGPPSSEHARREIDHAVRAGHAPGEPPPIARDDAVPGCACTRCSALRRGCDTDEAALTEDIVRALARLDPSNRLEAAARTRAAWMALGLWTPPAGWLVRRADEVPGAVDPTRDPADRGSAELPVEEARRASILDVARRLGCGDPEGRGGEPRVLCPLHDDHDPSLRLDTDRGLFFCDPCGEGGDVIDLAMVARGCSFSAAVNWIAGEGRR